MMEHMEMPTLCKKCGETFELTDGIGSKKWFPNIVICPKCGKLERKELEKDEEIHDLNSAILDAEFTIKECKERLKELEACA